MEIFGELKIEDKIWFNDAFRNRLRICGFTKDHIKKLKNSSLVDITLVDCDKEGIECKAYISISELTEEAKKAYEELHKELEKFPIMTSAVAKMIGLDKDITNKIRQIKGEFPPSYPPDDEEIIKDALELYLSSLHPV